jgi:hypothetical protein
MEDSGGKMRLRWDCQVAILERGSLGFEGGCAMEMSGGLTFGSVDDIILSYV